MASISFLRNGYSLLGSDTVTGDKSRPFNTLQTLLLV
jgi:hypothetical protein